MEGHAFSLQNQYLFDDTDLYLPKYDYFSLFYIISPLNHCRGVGGLTSRVFLVPI